MSTYTFTCSTFLQRSYNNKQIYGLRVNEIFEDGPICIFDRGYTHAVISQRITILERIHRSLTLGSQYKLVKMKIWTGFNSIVQLEGDAILLFKINNNLKNQMEDNDYCVQSKLKLMTLKLTI